MKTSLIPKLLLIVAGVVVHAPLIAQQGQQLSEPLDPRLDPPRIQFHGEPRVLSLEQVVLETLRNNLDIQIQDLRAGIAEDARDIQRSIYDPLLVTSLQRTHIHQETDTTGGGTGAAIGAPSRPDADDAFVIEEDTTTASGRVEQLLPTGGRVGVGFENNRREVDDSRSLFNTISPGVTQRAFVTVRQPLLRNFGPSVTNQGIRVARYRAAIETEQFRQTILDRLSDVMQAYWNLVFALENLEVQRSSLRAALRLAEDNDKKFRVGTIARVEVLQAEAEVAQRRNNVIEAKSNILAAQDELLRLMNWPGGAAQWSQPVMPADRPTSDGLALEFNDQKLYEEALFFSPQSQIAERQREIALLNRNVARWQRLPELNLIGEYSQNGFDDSRGGAFDDIRDSDYDTYSYGVELRYPLLNRRARAEYRQTLKEADIADLNIEQVRQRILTQIRAASRAVRTAMESIEASDVQVAAARDSVAAERNRVEQGVSTTFALLDLQEDLARAELNRIRALTNYQKGLVELERSRGTLLETLGVGIEPQPVAE